MKKYAETGKYSSPCLQIPFLFFSSVPKGEKLMLKEPFEC